MYCSVSGETGGEWMEGPGQDVLQRCCQGEGSWENHCRGPGAGGCTQGKQTCSRWSTQWFVDRYQEVFGRTSRRLRKFASRMNEWTFKKLSQ